MIRDVLTWWGRQLAALLPSFLVGGRPDTASQARIELLSPLGVQPATVGLVMPPGRRRAAPLELTLTDAGVVRLRHAIGAHRAMRLRLPAGSLLEREVALPIAAERAPEQVIACELDRLTPFHADATWWSCRVIRRDRLHGRLHLKLTLAPRQNLLPLLDTLRSAGARPTLLEAPDGRSVTLDEPGSRRHPARRPALALCGVLTVAVAVVPFVRQALDLSAVAAQRAATAPEAAEAGRLRRQIEAAAGGDEAALAGQDLGDPLQALAAATEALPDDTWLTDLTLRRRHMTLGGHSANAVQLIARLSAEPALRSPAFTAPVTRSDTGHGDLFSIGAELAP